MASSRNTVLGSFGLVAVTILGTLAVTSTFTTIKPLNFTPDGTSTGAVLQVNSVARYQEFNVQCAATGGLTTYTTCAARSPLTTTGTLLAAGIECGSWKVSMLGDFSFKKTLTSATGTVLTNLNNVAAATGANVLSQLAQGVSWNPADLLTFSSLVAPTGTLNTTRYDCQMWSRLLDKYGS